MSQKNRDNQGRWRSITVGFRVSPEEKEKIDAAVRISGLTKQDYIMKKLDNMDVVVYGNPRVYKALREEMRKIHSELQRIRSGENVDSDILDEIRLITKVMEGMKEDGE